jgi:hypothetical protein
VDTDQRGAVTRTRRTVAVHDALVTRRHDPRDALLDAERRHGDAFEGGAAGRLPFELERLAAAVLEHLDTKRMQAAPELRAAGLRRGWVRAVVANDFLAVDAKVRAVVAGEFELVHAGIVDLQETDDLDDELVRESTEAALGREVENLAPLVEVGRLLGHEVVQPGHRVSDVVDPERESGFELGLLSQCHCREHEYGRDGRSGAGEQSQASHHGRSSRSPRIAEGGHRPPAADTIEARFGRSRSGSGETRRTR